MVSEVNRVDGSESIPIKYFEKGHTFVSADSFLAQVEKEMRAKKNVYDFDDFTEVINKREHAVNMKYGDFRQWESSSSSAKFTRKPTLSSVQEVLFQKGSTKLFWKHSLEDAEYESGDFLKKKVSACFLKGDHPFRCKEEPRSVSRQKRDDIVSKLCPLMPENRAVVWNDIPWQFRWPHHCTLKQRFGIARKTVISEISG